MITETDEIARALDIAEAAWPGESRSRLAARLLVAGARTIAPSADDSAYEAVLAERLAGYGTLSDVYPSDYLHDLRAEWDA